jgi:predicted O-methyltransferase YrrM
MKIATDPLILDKVILDKALATPGWMSIRELTWLANVARSCSCIVEFGSFLGRSTRALADNAPENAKIYAVDPWNGPYKLDSGENLEVVDTYVMPQFIANLREYVESGKVIPIRNFSYNFYLTDYEYADMVFIDGDHRYDTVVKDIKKALWLLKPNGIICGHDYAFSTWPGVKKAVDKMLTNVTVEDTIWWTRK